MKHISSERVHIDSCNIHHWVHNFLCSSSNFRKNFQAGWFAWIFFYKSQVHDSKSYSLAFLTRLPNATNLITTNYCILSAKFCIADTSVPPPSPLCDEEAGPDHPSSCVPYLHPLDTDKIDRLRNVHESLRSSQLKAPICYFAVKIGYPNQLLKCINNVASLLGNKIIPNKWSDVLKMSEASLLPMSSHARAENQQSIWWAHLKRKYMVGILKKLPVVAPRERALK